MPPTHNIQRLMNLAHTLGATSRGLTRAEIMQWVPGYGESTSSAAAKQFSRDIARLNAVGFTVEVRPDPLGGASKLYRLQASASEEHVARLSPAGRSVLAVAATMWSTHNSVGYGGRLRAKLASHGISTAAVHVGGALGSSPALVALMEARERRDSVSFAYQKSPAVAPQEREVEPWDIDIVQGREYMLGFDVQKGSARLFRVSRVVNVPRVVGKAHTPHDPSQSVRAKLNETSLHDDVPETDEDETSVELEIAPYKALEVRRTCGVPPTASRARVGASLGEQVLTAALRDPLWIALRGDSAWTLAWRAVMRNLVDAHSPGAAQSAAAYPMKKAKAPKVRSVKGGDDDIIRLTSLMSYIDARARVALAELEEVFGVDREQLLDDLHVIFNSGDYSSGIDRLVDVDIDDDYVSIHGADALAFPLMLTHSDALTLLLGLDTALEAGVKLDPAAVGEVREVLQSIAPPSEHGADARGGAGATLPPDSAPGRSVAADDIPAWWGNVSPSSTARIMYSPADRRGVFVRDIRIDDHVIEHGTGYLRGALIPSGDPRTFRIDRIVQAWDPSDPDAPTIEDRTSPGPTVELEPVEVRLALRPSATWLIEAFGGQVMGSDTATGETLVRITPTFAHALVCAVFEARGAARIMNPEPYVKAVRDIAEGALEASLGCVETDV